MDKDNLIKMLQLNEKVYSKASEILGERIKEISPALCAMAHMRGDSITKSTLEGLLISVIVGLIIDEKLVLKQKEAS